MVDKLETPQSDQAAWAPLANRMVAGPRRPGQLLRPGKPLRFARIALRRIRDFKHCLWLSVRRLQLDIHVVPIADRRAAR